MSSQHESYEEAIRAIERQIALASNYSSSVEALVREKRKHQVDSGKPVKKKKDFELKSRIGYVTTKDDKTGDTSFYLAISTHIQVYGRNFTLICDSIKISPNTEIDEKFIADARERTVKKTHSYLALRKQIAKAEAAKTDIMIHEVDEDTEEFIRKTIAERPYDGRAYQTRMPF